MFAIALGTTEIILIVAVLFLLFGATRLPQLAKALGQSRKAFKEGMREAEDEDYSGNLLSGSGASKLAEMSDEEISREMRRRSEAKTN
ncbi:MAG TPA: twin-arginine translocase TatA/TatE family subunit [Pyrinomonadaceae bacterium]|nr:twin-arginine translocase TatA/TatE family subunit [Pyrinomonadaceae bacterium]HMP64290.1 twin-arginine translocase TatA/TatE family subunit [Pyrinomonadaceae bacterium]